MLHVNFNAYASYVTDSLYQWDVNQKLVINGLGLSVAPEIHFDNADMDRAIVRQSKITDGAIIVDIPNSLLQSALTIKAYVGVYEGDTFKTIETIEIPVIAKKKPYDYTIEDSDGEIYSFKQLENKIHNMIVGTGGSSARIGEVTLTAIGWIGNTSPYAQIVSIDGVTENSQVDLTPSVEQLSIFYEKDLTFVTENDNGVVTVYAIGQKPQNDYTIQVTITEVT